MNTLLLRSAAIWTAVGLVGGLAYREVTRSAGFTGYTQLAVVHTHALVLGTLVLLLTLVLNELFRLEDVKAFRLFVPVWSAGLALTTGMQAVKGFGQVHESTWATSKALAGVAGLGHMTLTAGFVILFLALGERIRAASSVTVTSGAVDARVEPGRS